MSTTFDLDPVDFRVARVVCTWLDNTEGAPDLMRAACTTAILEGSGTGNQPELYEHAVRNANGEYALYCATAGSYVQDAVKELLAGALPHSGVSSCSHCGGMDRKAHGEEAITLAQGMFADLLDFGNRALWAEVADTYMPDPAEVWDVANES